MRQVISASDVQAAAPAGFLAIPEGALVTPLAREAAARLGVELGVQARAVRACHVLGNWKMNLDLPQAVALLQRLAQWEAPTLSEKFNAAVFPPFPYLVLAAALLAESPFGIGAQNVHEQAAGAFTGEVSASMLRPMCQYVLVGHSERRQHCGETSELVWKKARTAIESSLTAVVCIGETAQERERGKTMKVLREQLDGVSKAISGQQVERLVVAYEPVWAIGSGRAAQLEDIEETHRQIRLHLRQRLGQAGDTVSLLYGGSVQAEVAAQLAGSVAVDGVLVGGASLDPDTFGVIATHFAGRSTC